MCAPAQPMSKTTGRFPAACACCRTMWATGRRGSRPRAPSWPTVPERTRRRAPVRRATYGHAASRRSPFRAAITPGAPAIRLRLRACCSRRGGLAIDIAPLPGRAARDGGGTPPPQDAPPEMAVVHPHPRTRRQRWRRYTRPPALAHQAADQPAQAKGDARRQQAQQRLTPARQPERRARREGDARADQEKADDADRQADAQEEQADAKDERKDGDDRAKGEHAERGD